MPAAKRKRSAVEAEVGAEKAAVSDGVSEDPTPAYATREYWEQRYKEGVQHHWYYTFDLLQPLFQSTLPKFIASASYTSAAQRSMLEIGCGDKPIADAFQAAFGYSRVVAVDFSGVIVQELREAAASGVAAGGAQVDYLVADARDMRMFNDESFDVVVDKGTIDAMASTDSSSERESSCSRIFSEVCRVMRPNACFYLISHVAADSEQWQYLLEEMLLPALQRHWARRWSIEVHAAGRNHAPPADSNTDADDGVADDDAAAAAVTVEVPASVYVIRCEPRRFTRSVMQKEPLPVAFRVLEYDSSDDSAAESIDEEEDET